MAGEAKSRSRRSHCGWCSIDGHHASACHLRAEHRREPDAADRLACAISTRGQAARARRGALADHLRQLEFAGAISIDEAVLEVVVRTSTTPRRTS